MTPEQKARLEIDRKLAEAGWLVQDRRHLNLHAGLGVALCETDVVYNLWKGVLDYFDAFHVGLTATPSPHTLGFFNQNLVSSYTHEQAVLDKVNVGYDIYRIRTKLTEGGATVERGNHLEELNTTLAA